MSYSLSSIIRSFDIFGYKIQLNINKEDKAHKTLFSGFISIAIQMSILSLIISQTSQMVNHDNNSVTTYKSLNNAEELNLGFQHSSSQVMVYQVMRKQTEGNRAIEQDDETSRYVNVIYKWVSVDNLSGDKEVKDVFEATKCDNEQMKDN